MESFGESPLEIAHILFTDIASYSTMTMEQQTESIDTLQSALRRTPAFQSAEETHSVISLPTGDGIAVVFFRDPEISARCALELAKELSGHPFVHLRMGINSGPVRRTRDVNGRENVAGDGINYAQRVMDSGDPGHIMVSKGVAEMFLKLGQWRDRVHYAGVYTTKHKEKLEIYSLWTDAAGRSVPSSRVKPAPAPPMVRVARAASDRRVWGTLAAAVAVLFVVNYFINPSATPLLNYSLTVQRYRSGQTFGQPMKLPGEMMFERDYGIAFEFGIDKEGFLYILDDGPDSKTKRRAFYLLSPLAKAEPKMGTGAQARIPQSGWFRFDDAQGEESLRVIWSKEPVAELERLRNLQRTQDVVAITGEKDVADLAAFLSSSRISAATAEKKDDRTRVSGTTALTMHTIVLRHM